LSPEQVAGELAVATLMVFPTRGDNSPNAVKEAVVAGLPVVASAVGGIPDYVFPDANGLLFPPGDRAGLLAAIHAACGHPRFGHGQVDDQALARVRADLSADRMGEAFFETYRHVAARP
jgi:glycosyltransferase involved in cell wall biosynthesis